MPPTNGNNSVDFGSGEGNGTNPISSPTDEVEISDAGRLMSDPSVSGDMRAERLARIKAAIDDGTYETAEKFEMAFSRMMGAMWDDE